MNENRRWPGITSSNRILKQSDDYGDVHDDGDGDDDEDVHDHDYHFINSR